MLTATSNSMHSPTCLVARLPSNDGGFAVRAAVRTATALVQSPGCSKTPSTRAISPPMPISARGVATQCAPVGAAEPKEPSPSDFVWKLAFRAMFEDLLRKPRLLRRDA